MNPTTRFLYRATLSAILVLNCAFGYGTLLGFLTVPRDQQRWWSLLLLLFWTALSVFFWFFGDTFFVEWNPVEFKPLNQQFRYWRHQVRDNSLIALFFPVVAWCLVPRNPAGAYFCLALVWLLCALRLWRAHRELRNLKARSSTPTA